MVGGRDGEPLGEGDSVGFEVFLRPRVVDHAETFGFDTADRVARVVQLLRLAHADDERPDGAGARGAEAAQARVTDLRVFGGDHEVGHHRQFAAAREAVAVNLRDGHLRHAEEVHVNVGDLLHARANAHEQPPALVVDCLVAANHRIGAAAGGREVVPGAEGAPGAADDDHAAGVIGFEVVEGVVPLVEQLLGEGVHLLGTVEGDAGYPAIRAHAVDKEVFVLCHARSIGFRAGHHRSDTREPPGPGR